MKRILFGVLFGWFFLSSLTAYAGFVKIDPTSFQIKNSPLVTGEALVGASGTQTLTNKTLGTDCVYTGNVIVDAYLDSALARDTEVTTAVSNHAGLSVGIHGVGAGVAVVGASTSQTLTNKSISGEQINSGTVAEGRIDATICRDSELATHAGVGDEVHEIPTRTGNSGKALGTTNGLTWSFIPVGGGLTASKRANVTLTVESAVATFSAGIIPGDIGSALIYTNGIYQFNFSKTSPTQITADEVMPVGTVVSLINLE